MPHLAIAMLGNGFGLLDACVGVEDDFLHRRSGGSIETHGLFKRLERLVALACLGVEDTLLAKREGEKALCRFIRTGGLDCRKELSEDGSTCGIERIKRFRCSSEFGKGGLWLVFTTERVAITKAR